MLLFYSNSFFFNELLLMRNFSKVYKVVFLFIMLLPAFKGKTQGLLFNSNDCLINNRTSYNVFKNDIPTFQDHLLISFDLSLWDNEHLGYVFNITDSKNNSYSLSYIHSNISSYLNFNIDSKSNKIKIPLSLAQLKKRNWMNIKINVNLKADRVEIFINGKWYKAGQFGFENKITPKITFGKNEHYFDVPNMAIKNLTISDDNKSYFFSLNEWSGKNVHNNSRENIGIVENPVWLINESYFWKLKFLRFYNEVVGLNFNKKDQNIFIFKSDSLVLYDIQYDKILSKVYQNKRPMNLLLGKSIVNPKEDKCYVYELNRISQQTPSI